MVNYIVIVYFAFIEMIFYSIIFYLSGLVVIV